MHHMEQHSIINILNCIISYCSIAIVRYLAREFNIAEKWYPKDSKQQARVDEFLEWQHLNIRLFGSMIFRHRVSIIIMTL